MLYLNAYFPVITIASSITTLLFIFVNNNRNKDEIKRLLDKIEKQKKEHEASDIEKESQMMLKQIVRN